MGEKVNTNEKIDSILDTVYSLFRSGEFGEASKVLTEALAIDFECEEIVIALKCAKFWEERRNKLRTLYTDQDKGNFLLEQWKIFVFFLENMQNVGEHCVYAIRQYVFGNGLNYFHTVLEKIGSHSSEILFKVGKCYKGKGDYEHALEYFEATNHQKPDDPEILAELADCYAFINEVKVSKIFFREAFYIDPQKIDITSLESMLIQRLIQKLKNDGFTLPDLLEWIPVFGVVYRVFNVTRELKPLEFGKLKQAIATYETELKKGNQNRPFIVPRLLNRYFWLIDHLMNTKDDRTKIDKVVEKVKNLDESIYHQYIK